MHFSLFLILRFRDFAGGRRMGVEGIAPNINIEDSSYVLNDCKSDHIIK